VNGIDLDLEEETSNGVSVSSCALHLHLGCNFLSKVNRSTVQLCVFWNGSHFSYFSFQLVYDSRLQQLCYIKHKKILFCSFANPWHFDEDPGGTKSYGSESATLLFCLAKKLPTSIATVADPEPNDFEKLYKDLQQNQGNKPHPYLHQHWFPVDQLLRKLIEKCTSWAVSGFAHKRGIRIKVICRLCINMVSRIRNTAYGLWWIWWLWLWLWLILKICTSPPLPHSINLSLKQRGNFCTNPESRSMNSATGPYLWLRDPIFTFADPHWKNAPKVYSLQV